MMALREDEFARKDRLADQLDYVNQLLNVTSRVNWSEDKLYAEPRIARFPWLCIVAVYLSTYIIDNQCPIRWLLNIYCTAFTPLRLHFYTLVIVIVSVYIICTKYYIHFTYHYTIMCKCLYILRLWDIIYFIFTFSPLRTEYMS